MKNRLAQSKLDRSYVVLIAKTLPAGLQNNLTSCGYPIAAAGARGFGTIFVRYWSIVMRSLVRHDPTQEASAGRNRHRDAKAKA